MAEAAAKQRLTHKAFLAEMLSAECDERDARQPMRRINEAKFPRTERLADFDPARLPDLPPATLAHLAGGAWIDAGEPLVLLGDSGTGKTRLLIALGTAAAEQGRRVRYVTTAALVNELVEAADNKQLSRVVGRYARLDLLCLDEVGYVHLDPRGAERLFQIITAREEQASIACASNASFSEWGTTFTVPRLAATVVDRLTYNAHIIQTGTASYRLATTAAQHRKDPATTSGHRDVDHRHPPPNPSRGWGQIKQHSGAKWACHSHAGGDARLPAGLAGLPEPVSLALGGATGLAQRLPSRARSVRWSAGSDCSSGRANCTRMTHIQPD